jgi:hypothetical protein
MCTVGVAACTLPWWLPDVVSSLDPASWTARNDDVAQTISPKRTLKVVPLD